MGKPCEGRVGTAKQSIYEEVIERDQGACVSCGRAGACIHHVVPRSMLPGKRKLERDQLKNLEVLCVCCHLQAHTKEARARDLTRLRDQYGYRYNTQPWLGVLGEAEFIGATYC